MNVYELQYTEEMQLPEGQAYSLAIGFFDGLHKGHQAVIQTAIEKAERLNIQSAVMTFDPHPSHVLGGGKKKVGYITPHEEKVAVLTELGVDALFVIRFNKELAALSPEAFVDTFIKRLNVQHVVAGFDFTFGQKGAGTMADMKSLANGAYTTAIVEKVSDEVEKISSTRIRQLLAEGKVEETAKLLGRNFRTIGTVEHGAKNGRKLGFPTANVTSPEAAILPLNGVYAVKFHADGKTYNGVCNVGIKPTFDEEQKAPMVEVHILDFDGDLYGKAVKVEWLYFIREEKKFDSFEALIEQITADKETAKKLLV